MASEDAPKQKKKNPKRKNWPPELALVDPKPRTYSNSSIVNEQPCGGTEKAHVHYLATPGSKNYVQWKVSHPSANGNCTVRVGAGTDEDFFIVLRPRDGMSYRDGSFPCGREVGYEGREFKFPKNITCDSCTLQIEFSIPTGQIHQCADIVMIDNQSTSLFPNLHS